MARTPRTPAPTSTSGRVESSNTTDLEPSIEDDTEDDLDIGRKPLATNRGLTTPPRWQSESDHLAAVALHLLLLQ